MRRILAGMAGLLLMLGLTIGPAPQASAAIGGCSTWVTTYKGFLGVTIYLARLTPHHGNSPHAPSPGAWGLSCVQGYLVIAQLDWGSRVDLPKGHVRRGIAVRPGDG